MIPAYDGNPNDPEPAEDPTEGDTPVDDPSAEEESTDPTPAPLAGRSEKVPQQLVVYLTADQGPFACQHCHYWQDPDSCTLVEGKIDPEGLCHLFLKADDSGAALGADETEPAPEQLPGETDSAESELGIPE